MAAASSCSSSTPCSSLSMGTSLDWYSRMVCMLPRKVGLSTITASPGFTSALRIRSMPEVLPVVGSIIADASESVLAGASILRNAIGIFGLLAVLGTCLLPFLRLGANYLLYKAAAGLSAAVADSRITRLVNAISAAFGMMLGLVGATALMLFISIISVIKVVM